MAGAYVIVVSLGIPICMVLLMVRRMKDYAGASVSERFVARRVADELKLEDHVAADAIRDVSTGREYSFLVNVRPASVSAPCTVLSSYILIAARPTQAFKPRFYYWEGYDMIRKLMLVGMLLIAGRGRYHTVIGLVTYHMLSSASRCLPG